MNRIRHAVGALWRDERGMTLPLALLALLVLVAQSSALLALGSSEVQIAANLRDGTQAHFLAEAGLEDGFNTLRNPLNLSLITAAPAQLGPLLLSGSGTVGSFGSYSLQYQSAGANTVMVVATGTAGAAQRILRTTLSTQFTTDDAFLTNGDLDISGNPTFNGACGKAHTNADLEIEGTPLFTTPATASGTYSGDPGLGQGGQATKTIPPINPTSFLTAAKQTLPANQIFQMKSLVDGVLGLVGIVLDGNGVLLATLLDGQSYNGWKFKSGGSVSWEYNDNTAYDGTYYIEGEVKVSGRPGSSATPWKTTILATGNIEISGSPTVSSHLKDTFLVSGLDIKISGSGELGGDLAQGGPGIIAAHEQIKISGKPAIKGYIIAENATATSNTVTEDEVTGNLSITYNCGLNPPLQGPPGYLQVLAWGS